MMSAAQNAINLLRELIAVPSPSGQEDETADLISDFLQLQGVQVQRIGNNVVGTYNGGGNASYLMLCSHHDTVSPNALYTRDPYTPEMEDGKLFGLGSNDAGAALVSLIATFLHFQQNGWPVNLVLAAVAEEEISGAGGVSSILHKLPAVDLAVVGEPTGMKLAVAEKGLVVIDGLMQGTPGHAAHENTLNPILQVCHDILAIHTYDFDKVSEFLGKTKATVTVVNAGELHNQVPANCSFVIDVRVNEKYSLEEVVERIQSVVKSDLHPRSLRLRSSGIPENHKILTIAHKLKIPLFGSPTLSDQALLPFASVKIGPGDTLRSHTADEFVFLEEIESGINQYIKLIEAYIKHP